MKYPTFAVRLVAAGAACAALLAGIPALAAVPGILGGTTLGGAPAGPKTFALVATEGYSSQPDGASVYSWGYGCAAAPAGFAPAAMATIGTCPLMQIPGPTMIVNEGDTVTVTLANNLPVAAGNTSIVFSGLQVTATNGVAGVLTQEAAHGGTVTYSFTATKPGTYAYYSGTQSDLQIEMGLYGAVIVLPANPAAIANCTGAPHAADAIYRLADAAYDHPQSCYDREYLFQLAEMESSIHDAALAQKTACENLLAGNPGASCAPIAVRSEPYHPNYFLVNGRSMPDDMDANYAALLPNQPYNGNPHMHPHELVLVRVIGQGRIQHPLHIHGNHARVLARDGNLLLVPNDVNSPLAGGIARLAGPLIFTFPSVSGESVDAIFTWTGKGLNWDVYGHNPASDAASNVVCVPDGDGYYTINSLPPAPRSAPNYGEWCADHDKPIPVTPADPQILANGLWYGGTPYLGLSESAASGFPSTPLPPGTAKQNASAGYAFMWHSHDEREITTNDVFPGGMMMMLIVDPPAAVIDESK